MGATLSEHARALLRRPVIGSLSTVAPGGGPQITPLWVDVDGDDILVNTARGRAKERNIERDPRVALSVIDPEDAYNVVVVVGKVVENTPEGADAHIDFLAKKYLGADTYPFRAEGEERRILRIRPDRVVMQKDD